MACCGWQGTAPVADPGQHWFAVSRWHGRITAVPIHWRGWLALVLAIAMPHLAWLVVPVPGAPRWLVPVLFLPLLLGALAWLFRVALRRGRITDYRG